RRPRRWLTSVGAAVRRLRAAGLTPMSAYWVRPGFESAQAYLPLEDGRSGRWYLRNVYTAMTLRERLVELGLRVATALPGGVRRSLIPAFAVTASAGGAPGVPSVLSLAAVDGEALADASLLLLTAGRDDWNRVVAMPFRAGSARPAAVLKLSR